MVVQRSIPFIFRKAVNGVTVHPQLGQTSTETGRGLAAELGNSWERKAAALVQVDERN